MDYSEISYHIFEGATAEEVAVKVNAFSRMLSNLSHPYWPVFQPISFKPTGQYVQVVTVKRKYYGPHDTNPQWGAR